MGKKLRVLVVTVIMMMVCAIPAYAGSGTKSVYVITNVQEVCKKSSGKTDKYNTIIDYNKKGLVSKIYDQGGEACAVIFQYNGASLSRVRPDIYSSHVWGDVSAAGNEKSVTITYTTSGNSKHKETIKLSSDKVKSVKLDDELIRCTYSGGKLSALTKVFSDKTTYAEKIKRNSRGEISKVTKDDDKVYNLTYSYDKKGNATKITVKKTYLFDTTTTVYKFTYKKIKVKSSYAKKIKAQQKAIQLNFSISNNFCDEELIGMAEYFGL